MQPEYELTHRKLEVVDRIGFADVSEENEAPINHVHKLMPAQNRSC